ncbi:MAG: hypothetical protein IKU42_03015 [Oscillospiraceae bacterium]|nr:hypothetical protein [Oscillospiraceae bacterium]
MKKKREKIIVPIFETNPIAKSEKGSKENKKEAIEMAKEWVEEHKL